MAPSGCHQVQASVGCRALPAPPLLILHSLSWDHTWTHHPLLTLGEQGGGERTSLIHPDPNFTALDGANVSSMGRWGERGGKLFDSVLSKSLFTCVPSGRLLKPKLVQVSLHPHHWPFWHTSSHSWSPAHIPLDISEHLEEDSGLMATGTEVCC